MSRGLNRVQLIGNLGQRPETRQTSTGTLIANLRLATSSSWTDKAGERQEATEWHRCVAFGRVAEIAQQYLDKGSRVYIEGRIQTRKWNGDDGREHYANEIIVSELIMLDGRSEAARPAPGTVEAPPL